MTNHFHLRLFGFALLFPLVGQTLSFAASSGKAPTSFVLPQLPGVGESRWRQTGLTEYVEEYPSSAKRASNKFRIAGRAKINGINGTILRRTEGVEVFVPDMGAKSTWVGFRVNKGSWNKQWRQMSNAKRSEALIKSFQRQKKTTRR